MVHQSTPNRITTLVITTPNLLMSVAIFYRAAGRERQKQRPATPLLPPVLNMELVVTAEDSRP